MAVVLHVGHVFRKGPLDERREQVVGQDLPRFEGNDAVISNREVCSPPNF